MLSALAIGFCAAGALVGTSCRSNGGSAESAAATPGEAEKTVGEMVDKSADSTLQAMIREVAPKFRQEKYTVPGSDEVIEYNLYVPENLAAGQKYPLVLFVADASTADREVTAPLTQGYGALVWATPEWQASNPCLVLVPQMKAGATDDQYNHSKQVDDVIGLVRKIAADYPVDANRLYSTGQSMGGMMAMYYDVAYPDMFAASIFVDSHWAESSFPQLVKHKFVWFIAGENGKAYPTMKPLEEAAEKVGVNYTYAAWSAQLPMERQDELAATMLEKGAPVNIFEFETGTVLPEGVTGMDHIYSFDYAYRNTAVRDWLFKQTK